MTACVCERERDRITSQHISYLNRSVCVCVCVCLWMWERETGSLHSGVSCLNCGLCMCERARERDRVTSQWSQRSWSRLVYKHIRASSLCLSRDSVLLSAWSDGKTKDIINCLYIYFERRSSQLWKGVLLSEVACGVRPITMHCAGWPIRADCACRKEGLCRKRRVWEAGHRGTTIMYSIWKKICFLNTKACQHIFLPQIHKIMIFKKASNDPFKKFPCRYNLDMSMKLISSIKSSPLYQKHFS